MSTIFLDTSALAKRYLPEKGTRWLRKQLASADTIIVSRITSVEVMSAVARRQREGVLHAPTVGGIERLLLRHMESQYVIVEVTNAVTRQAIELLRRQPLRAYDAVQLASAIVVNRRLGARILPPALFLFADTRLLEVAENEGLMTGNPSNHT